MFFSKSLQSQLQKTMVKAKKHADNIDSTVIHRSRLQVSTSRNVTGHSWHDLESFSLPKIYTNSITMEYSYMYLIFVIINH